MLSLPSSLLWRILGFFPGFSLAFPFSFLPQWSYSPPEGCSYLAATRQHGQHQYAPQHHTTAAAIMQPVAASASSTATTNQQVTPPTQQQLIHTPLVLAINPATSTAVVIPPSVSHSCLSFLLSSPRPTPKI
jgi:hypothetical protein